MIYNLHMKKAALLFVLLFGHKWILAQSTNALALPSANNNFLGQAGLAASATGVGVNLYTGSAQIRVPVCNAGTQDMGIPVAINYAGGRGIKVQDYATCVGIGWQLDAGGSISRAVRGLPDEGSHGYVGTGLWGQNVANWANGNAPLSSEISGINGTSFSIPTADGEPDIFYVKTPFFSFQFVFDEFGNPVFNNSTGLKIIATNFYNSPYYIDASFIVIDDVGNKYFFGSSVSSVERTIMNLYGSSYTSPTTWYLDKIVLFNSKETIHFDYINSGNDEPYSHTQSTFTFDLYGCSTNTDNTTTTSTLFRPKYLSRISSRIGEVDFTYMFDRRDVQNAARLTRIDIKSVTPTGTATLQTFGFQYSYFGDPSSDMNLLRLRLDNITVAGNTASTATPVALKTFIYNASENLPSRTSNQFDYWGYYTSFGAASNPDPMQNPGLREPNEARTKANVLTAIKDISGGSWELTYELNSYFKSSANANINVGGLRVASIAQTLSTGEKVQVSYSYVDDNGHSTGQVLSGSYNNLVNVWISADVIQVLSETPSNIYDINGSFIGYSTVKTIQQNGGYTISAFTNFSDFPDEFNFLNTIDPNTAPSITSSTSKAYKRGLPVSETVYNSAGNKITESVNAYQSLTSPVTQKSWAFHLFIASYNVCGASGYTVIPSVYRTRVEDYVLSSITRKDYDQLNPARYVQNAVYYSYANNKRLIRSVTSTNSAGVSQTKTTYYPEDMTPSGTGIPLLTTAEQPAITNLVNSNRTNVVVHETSEKSGIISHLHNSYSSYVYGTDINVYLSSTAAYNNTALLKKQFFNYDISNSNVISSNELNGKSTAFLYGYNAAYPVAKIVNASATSSGTTQTQLGYHILVSPGVTSFTNYAVGDIIVQFGFEQGPGDNSETTVYYQIWGAAYADGFLCINMTPTPCYYPSDITLPNMPAGTYYISASITTNEPDRKPYVIYRNTELTTSLTYTNEFFYESFEQNPSAYIGSAHTGNAYWNTSYTTGFAPPNGRTYMVQWWNLVSGKWVFNEQTYSQGMTLSGPVDDVRIFPSDAQMTTFTYNPLVGKTGETDPSGRTASYEYDGMGRLHIVRDNDKNIVSKTCYSIQGWKVNCGGFTNMDQSGNYYSQNCGANQTAEPYYVSVPAGMFISPSQADADQQAQQYGQEQANMYGSCHTNDFPLIVNANTYYPYIAELTNTSTGEYFWFEIPNYGSTIAGYIPEGNYDIYLYSYNDYYYRSFYVGCGYYNSGYMSANFYGVYLNQSCNTIEIY